MRFSKLEKKEHYTKFKPYELPNFFTEKVIDYAKNNSITIDCEKEHFTFLFMQQIHVFDHWGSAILKDGSPCLVSQPYGIGGENLLAAEHFAKKLGLTCYVHPFSQYGQDTLSVIFYEYQTPATTFQKALINGLKNRHK